MEWNCVLETTIKLRIGSFNQLLLGSIQTVFIRPLHDHLIEKSTNPPKLLFILSLLVKVFDVCVSNLTYLKHLSAYQYSLFNIQWATPCLCIVFDQCSFFYVSTCLLNGNQFHLMDQTTLKRIVVITLFMLHSFDCLIVICAIQQMTLLS